MKEREKRKQIQMYSDKRNIRPEIKKTCIIAAYDQACEKQQHKYPHMHKRTQGKSDQRRINGQQNHNVLVEEVT